VATGAKCWSVNEAVVGSVRLWVLTVGLAMGCGGAAAERADPSGDTAANGQEAQSAPLLTLSGPIEGDPRTPTEVVLVWEVSAGNPDYAFLWGRSEVTSERYTLSVSDWPDFAALNNGTIGVAHVVLVKVDRLNDGQLGQEQLRLLREVTRGGAEGWAVVFKVPGLPRDDSSLGSLPDGYTCARGTEPAAGGTFDGFEAADCGEVPIRLGAFDEIEFVNWT